MRNTRRASRLAAWACAAAIGIGVAKAWAQAPSPEADATEQRRLRQRIEDQREKLESRPDIHLDLPVSHAGTPWPENEAPCFFIERLRWDGLPAHGWSWLPGLFSQGTDTPIGRCLGALGVAAVVQRAQNAVVAHGYQAATLWTMRHPTRRTKWSSPPSKRFGAAPEVYFDCKVGVAGTLYASYPLATSTKANISKGRAVVLYEQQEGRSVVDPTAVAAKLLALPAALVFDVATAPLQFLLLGASQPQGNGSSSVSR